MDVEDRPQPPRRRHAVPSQPRSAPDSTQGDGNNAGRPVRRGDEHVSRYKFWDRTNQRNPFFQADADYDVLDHHHLNNRRRRSPDPSYLSDVRDRSHQAQSNSKRRRVGHDAARPNRLMEYEVPTAEQRTVATARAEREVVAVPDTTEEAPGRHGKYSRNPKRTVTVQPWHIGFYPTLWRRLLETAKTEMRRSLFRNHPFHPDKKTAVDGECYEVLLSVIARYDRNGEKVEKVITYYDRNGDKVDKGALWYSALTYADNILSSPRLRGLQARHG